MREADASQIGYDIAASCLNGPSLLASEASEKVDKLLDLYDASDHDPAMKSDIRDTAGTMRDCGMREQADRLNDATD